MSRWPSLVALVVAGCGSRPAPPPGPPPVPLHIEPACDLAPAAGVQWIAEVKPRTIAEIPDLIPAIATVLPEERMKMFVAGHGGVDLRQIKDLCIARYKEATLTIAHVPFDPEKIASALDARSPKPTTRTVVTPNPRVVRMTGEVEGEPRQLVMFGREAIALEDGKPGPLRAAEAFGFMKLKKAVPALKGAALVRASEVLGNAPVRVFAPGPFEGEMAKALGGLLRAATSVGASVKWTGTKANLAIRIVLTGGWGSDAPAASERLGAAAHVLSESAVGRLFGIDRPVQAPFVHVEPDALVLDATIDGDALARGIHDAVDAEVGEIMRK